jgi:hypothetical protein
VALDEEGHPRFEWLVNRGPQKDTLVYYVFDLLGFGGKDLRGMLLLTRKIRLQRLLKKHQGLIYVDHIEGRGLEMFARRLGTRIGGNRGQGFQKPLRRRPSCDVALAEDQEQRLQTAGEGGIQAKTSVSVYG